ncbi:UDP-N-acetylmuramoyl-L-alanine--D-glutamate ligase [Sphingomonas sp. AX6]|uniref:UDP-N-acetylmuramoyl-L-alanine--D-glutamate ligase n=1 Tax=Sphingomonas sp. AX6 TaxID=2653171 RepID=UPI0012F16FE4|nr:UDP-N-acetylmuramoyl-L-alanine--D-glutamate ligase [Sphingomonas sp. AX6]VXC75991.1 UDP-N-acetylmuramoylalanine--D-glutamate ligase [Sphingomonas sp. AX6]
MAIFDGARTLGIWGYGREGQAVHRFVRAQYSGIAVTVLLDQADYALELPKGVALLNGDSAVHAIAQGRFDVIVKSPGISLKRQEIVDAKAAGTRVTSSTNLWLEANGVAGTIGVTGTKGKSTTSTLILHMLRAAGRDAKLLGNAGTAAIGEAPAVDHTILELSSYQTADLDRAPALVVVNNLYPEHVPWHGSVEAYYDDKLRLATIECHVPAVLNYRDAEIRKRLGERANVTWFNDGQGYTAVGASLSYQGRPVSLTGAVPKGEHNLSNVAAAATVALLLDALEDPWSIDLGGFATLPHRMEEFAVGGLTCVDDSISTVPQATMAALSVYAGRPIHLILGGSERGQDHAALPDAIRAAGVVSLWLLPDTGRRMEAEFAGRLDEVTMTPVADLDAAVRGACELADEGDVLLLSPAAPSFVQFRSFEERGAQFRALCERYADNSSPGGGGGPA